MDVDGKRQRPETLPDFDFEAEVDDDQRELEAAAFPAARLQQQQQQLACVVCENDDPDGVCDMQRCDGGCDRWFCIEGACASTLGIPYDKHLSAGDIVCADCARLEKRLEQTTATPMSELGLLASDDA